MEEVMGVREAGRLTGGYRDDGCMHWGVTVERERGGQIGKYVFRVEQTEVANELDVVAKGTRGRWKLPPRAP